MSAFDKYNTPPPKVSNKNNFDNPLLPRAGIPLADDDFVDSTDRIVNATNTNDVRFDTGVKVGNHNVWSVDPSQFYDSSGLAGIDATPNGSSKRFDLGQFNKVFDRNKEIAKESQRISDLNKLNALSQETVHVSLYDLSLYQIIINTKNTWFNLLDDLLDQKFELETFTKENRLFFIGLTVVFFAVVLYLYATIMTDDSDQKDSTPNQEMKTVYHIYQYPPPQPQLAGTGTVLGATPGLTTGLSRITPGQQNRLSTISDFSSRPANPIIGKKK